MAQIHVRYENMVDRVSDTSEVEETGVAAPQVLLVEDRPSIIHLIRHILDDGHRFTAVQTFDEALDLAREVDFDVFLIDIELEDDRSGIHLLDAIRALRRHRDTPAVAVTAHALPGDRERILSAGFDAYLAKPFVRSELHETVRNALRAG